MNKVELIDGQVTEHFNIYEFKCKDHGEILLNQEVIEHINRLEKFRKWYGRVMIVNSGYRTADYNNKIGGAANSMHIKGIASDIALPMDEFNSYTKERQEEFLNNVKNKWIQLCQEDGLGGGVGFYDTFFHLDSRPIGSYENGAYAFWDNRTGK